MSTQHELFIKHVGRLTLTRLINGSKAFYTIIKWVRLQLSYIIEYSHFNTTDTTHQHKLVNYLVI